MTCSRSLPSPGLPIQNQCCGPQNHIPMGQEHCACGYILLSRQVGFVAAVFHLRDTAALVRPQI